MTSVGQLVKKKFVVWTENDILTKQNGWHPLQKKLVAIELKMKRFEEALHQATTNKQLTVNSFVAMPIGPANRIARCATSCESLKNNGIGLLAVSPTKCERLIKPIAGEVEVLIPAQMQCVERFWNTYVKDRTS